MLKSLSSVVIAVMVAACWTAVTVRGASLPQPKDPAAKAVPMDKRDFENIARLAAKVKADADAAGAPQGRAAMGPLIGSVSDLEQELQSFIRQAERPGNADTLKKLDGMRKQFSELQKEKQSLMKLSQQKADDARARGTAARRIKSLTDQIVGSVQRLRPAGSSR